MQSFVAFFAQAFNLLNSEKRLVKDKLIQISLFALSMWVQQLYAQCPTSAFVTNSTFCLGEAVPITNNSVDATSYTWDFCSGELEETLSVSTLMTVTPATSTFDMAIVVDDNGVTHAFVTSSGTDNLVRVDTLINYTTAPTIVDLETTITDASGIDIIKEGSSWYGFVSSTSGAISRLTFSDLSLPPAVESLTGLTAVSNSRGLKVIKEGSDFYVLNVGGNSLQVIKFNGDILDDSYSELVTTVTGASFANGIDVYKECNTWYGVVTSGVGGSHQIAFTSGLDIAPTTSAITGAPNAGGVSILYEAEKYYAFSTNISTKNVVRFDFGSSLAIEPTPVDIGSYSLSTSTAMEIEFINGRHYGFILELSTNELSVMSFDRSCDLYSNDETPTGFSYSESGSYDITLYAHNSNGNTTSSTQTITVNSTQAPNIDFSTTNQCIDQTNTFTSIDDADISTYSWDFNEDDTEDSTSPTPVYDYSLDGIGTYTVTLDVVGNNGCSNSTSHDVSIYDAPTMTPDYDYAAAVLCTNTEFTFSNMTDDTGYEEVLAYYWNFNDEANSTEANPTYTFTTAGTKTVSLTALIPGCSTMVYSEDIEILEGPSVSYSYTNNCYGEAIAFTDESTGANITGYSWDFGDASGTSTDQDPDYTFASTGDYEVTLTVTNMASCENSSSQTITVSDDPKIDFSTVDLIENLPTDFTSIDLTQADDAINGWTWDFDGLDTSNDQNPSYTFPSPNDYTINLSVTTVQGCNDSVEKDITISESSCAISAFDISKTIFCTNEELDLTNNSTNAASYTWDFCSGELEEALSVEMLAEVTPVTTSFDMAIVVDDDGVTHAFVTSSGTDNLIRVDTLINYSTAPTVVDLETIITGVSGIDIIKEGSSWYGFVSSTSGAISRLTFSDLSLAPSVEPLIGLTAVSDSRDLKIIKEGSDFYVLNVGGSSLQVIKFNGDILDNSYTEVVSSVTGASFANGIDVYRECDTWYGIVTSGLGGTHQIVFDNGLEVAPTTSSITDAPNAGGVSILYEAEKYYAFSTIIGSSNVVRFDYGSSLALEPTPIDLGTYSLATSTSLEIERIDGKHYGFIMELSTNDLSVMSFDRACDLYSVEETPTSFSYSEAGTYDITLYAHHANGNATSSTQTITVSTAVAPDIDFSTSNECLGQTNTFTPDIQTYASYSWDFDSDGLEDSNAINPDFILGANGDHSIALTVNDGTCSNRVVETVTIYDTPPTPSFSYTTPSDPTLCSGSIFSFTNSSDESNHVGATISYDWDFGGEGSSTDSDPDFTFTDSGTQNVELTMSIPGCSSQADQDIILLAGPTVDFSYEDKCLGDVTAFSNLTTGENITGQVWDFGDLNGTTDLSPSHEYEAAGDYSVSLSVENAVGCSNTLITSLTIDDRPTADFSMGVGCEGQVVGFEDKSSVSSANIDFYTWDFGGLGSSTQEDPLYIFDTIGDYEINLIVESTFGCTDEITKNLSVQQAPVADFSIDLGCLDATTQFIDQTVTEEENPINVWYWVINGDVVPNTQNPTEIFDTAGDYSASLTITPSNLCVSSITKEFTVHELPVAGFTTSNLCDNEFATFTDASTSSTTSIEAYNWTFGDEATGNSNPAVFNFDEAGDYDVTLTVIDEIGCESTAQSTVTINTSPVAAFEVNENIGQVPLLVEFTNQSDGATSSYWQFGDNDQSTSSETNPSFTYIELGDYEASLVASNDLGCTDTTTFDITVAEPILDLELVQISREVSEGKINLTLSVKNSGNVVLNGFDIRIDLNNNASIYERYTGEIRRNETITYMLNFTLSEVGNNIKYTCISVLDLEDAYEDIDEVNNEGCVNFDQNLIIEDSYPNPVSSGDSNIRLNLILPAKGPVQLFLMDASGGNLYQTIHTNTEAGLNSFFIDISSFKQGMYFIKVVYDNKTSTQRFVKI
ncbi:MAG: PKD domain-containing protein [Reichenbachiella sp.]|uniref:PKD domain-containing protein n=1 Tax=Reichenbachiella sp. TaxID=2184521 RepID=UPI0032659539